MFKNSIIYMLAEIINKGVPFLLLPVLTKYLTPYDYGIIASFSSFIGFISIFIGLSVHGAINITYFKHKKEILKIYIANGLFLVFMGFLIVSLFVYLFQQELSHKLLLESEWLYIGLIVAFSQIITLINLTLWISEKKSKIYSFYQIGQTIMQSILTLVLIIGYNYNWEGQLISILVASLSFAILSLYLLKLRGYLEFKYSVKDIKDLLHFGIPLIPHQLSGWLTTSGDRLLLIAMVGASTTGIFTIGYQIGMIMSVLVTAFHKAWNPYIYEKLSIKMDLVEKIKIVKFTYLYFISIIVVTFILNELGFYIFKYFISSNFLESYQYVIYILIEYAINGMYFMVVSYIFFFKRTKLLAIITFVLSLLHILLSYIFINLYGAIGVAYSGIISYTLMFFSVWYYSNKIYPMPWLFWRYQ